MFEGFCGAVERGDGELSGVVGLDPTGKAGGGFFDLTKQLFTIAAAHACFHRVFFLGGDVVGQFCFLCLPGDISHFGEDRLKAHIQTVAA